jgi:hypothetical protein
VLASTVAAIGMAGLAAGCSSSNDNGGPRGSLAITIGATRAPTAEAVQAAAGDRDDALSHLSAAVVTIASLEASFQPPWRVCVATTKKSATGTQLWGPSGASIWNAPTIDATRNLLYVGTGNNFSDPPTRTSDAIVAMDLDSGKVRWSRQMTASDAWIVGCRLPDKTNCADANGPDFDFSSSPILVTMTNGRRMLVAGQKAGMVHGLDPDADGKVIWSVKVGEGGTMGGVQWGSAADGQNVYVANSDIGRIMLTYSSFTDADTKRGGGRTVTFPARQYNVNGERRSFALLRPIVDTSAQGRVRELILDAYAEWEAQASVAS